MIIDLKRFQYSETETMGVLILPTVTLYTIERPWVPVKSHKGGRPFHSCVPDGLYELLPFESDKYPETWVLQNKIMDVHAYRGDVPDTGGRYTCVLHSGNYVRDIEGCISPGLSRVIMGKQNAVASSRDAMGLLRAAINGRSERQHFLQISPVDGTAERLSWQSLS